MRFVATVAIAASLVLALRGQERKAPLTLQSIESILRDRLLPDETLAIEIRERGVSPLLRWREVQRLRDIGIGLATVSALERYVQALSLTLIVEPALAGLKVSVVSSGFGTSLADRTGTTDSAGRVLIDGLRPGAYRVSLTPPPTHRFIGREVVLGDEGSVERLTLLAAPAKLSIPIQNARVTIGSAGSYSGPVRNLELPPGTYPVSVSKVGYLDYTASITVGPGEEKSLTPSLKREPVQYPVIHRHNWGRCWGTFLVSDDRLEYQQSGSSGKDSFEVPTTQISSVSQWSQNQLEIVLKDGRKLHFAHGVMKTKPKDMAVTLEDIVDVRPVAPLIDAILRTQQISR